MSYDPNRTIAVTRYKDGVFTTVHMTNEEYLKYELDLDETYAYMDKKRGN